MGAIPVYIMEEHSEAFYYWGLALSKGEIPKTGNTLFHVDHHDDLEGGGYFHDFTKEFSGIEDRKEFTYQYLGIADFIIPAIYDGIFQTLYNMKMLRKTDFVKQSRVILRRSENELYMTKYIPFLHGQFKEDTSKRYTFFDYYEGSLAETGMLEQVVLDIDLDYFCWDNSLKGVPPKRIEITKDAYRDWQENPYHPLRILPKRAVYVEEVQGRYYLRYEEPDQRQEIADEEKVARRIERFFEWLGELPWKPVLIDICRSATSGYMPPERVRFVEERVLDGLSGLYQLKF